MNNRYGHKLVSNPLLCVRGLLQNAVSASLRLISAQFHKFAIVASLLGLSGCAGTFVKPDLNTPNSAARTFDRQ